jgi:hypothetical protein
MKATRVESIRERFALRVQKLGDGCWEWQGYQDPVGYGRFRFRGTMWLAHRVSWVLANGEIPDRLLVCHRCDNPPCVNPGHLFLGTTQDNALDKMSKGRHWAQKITHCPAGHEYDHVNTHHRPDGRRDCRTCRRERIRAKRAGLRAEE